MAIAFENSISPPVAQSACKQQSRGRIVLFLFKEPRTLGVRQRHAHDLTRWRSLRSLARFRQRGMRWHTEMQGAVSATRSPGPFTAIDGKVLQRSFDDAAARSPVHLMFVFAAQARLTLGQVRANGISIETMAMPALPNPHNFKGSVVTAGAMHAQRPALRRWRSVAEGQPRCPSDNALPRGSGEPCGDAPSGFKHRACHAGCTLDARRAKVGRLEWQHPVLMIRTAARRKNRKAIARSLQRRASVKPSNATAVREPVPE